MSGSDLAAWWDALLSWLDKHNGLVTALATAALALLTGILAIENNRLLKASARATETTERALELDWLPVLTFHHTTDRSDLGGFPMAFAATYVRNVGRGPAVNVRFLRRKVLDDGTKEWEMTKRFSLAGGDTIDRHAWVSSDPHQGEPAEEVWGGVFPKAKEVLICQDQAGHLYRFIDPEPNPDKWQEGDPGKAWVDWYQGLLDSD
jgi:hypothetical protein